MAESRTRSLVPTSDQSTFLAPCQLSLLQTRRVGGGPPRHTGAGLVATTTSLWVLSYTTCCPGAKTEESGGRDRVSCTNSTSARAFLPFILLLTELLLDAECHLGVQGLQTRCRQAGRNQEWCCGRGGDQKPCPRPEAIESPWTGDRPHRHADTKGTQNGNSSKYLFGEISRTQGK